jgi:hypothetical protein
VFENKFKMYVWYANFGWNDRCRIILPGLDVHDAISRYKRGLERLNWQKDDLVNWVESHKPDEEDDFEGWFYVENQRDD